MSSYILRRSSLGKTSCREIAKASVTGIEVFRNDGMNYLADQNKYVKGNPPAQADYVFRWGVTSEIGGGKVVNKSEAIHKINNKGKFRKLCYENGIAMKTWLPGDNLNDIEFPVVVRRNNHAQGKNLHVCKNNAELKAAIAKYPDNYYISMLINKVSEYRIFFVCGRVVWVANKTPGNPNQVAWNVAQGGAFNNVNWGDWPLKAIKASYKAFELSGLDFGGVDVMIDAAGNCYVLEINSAPSQTSPYRQQCTAKAFDYIVKNGRDKIPLVDKLGGYLKFIHPCMDAKALIG